MEQLILPSFAKINLVLRVLRKRRDGYHTLETVFQTIDLHDELTFSFYPSTHFHLVLDVGKSEIPADSSNLIYKACHLFHEAHPVPVRIEVQIEKRIPLQAGLGGGSSNAAVSLIALSRYFRRPLKRTELLSLARRLGADVPFFLYGGTALGTGRGDRIRRLPDWPSFPTLLVHPGIPCSTPGVYRSYDESGLLTRNRDFIKIHLDQRPESLKDLVILIENDLEQVVFAHYPELDSIKKKFVEAGAVTVSLTGSGSSLFGFFKTDGDPGEAAKKFPASTVARFVNRAEYRARVFGGK